MEEQQFAQTQQDKQIANDPNAMYADVMREERATNILAQINPDLLLTDIEHRIRGEKKDISGQVWIKISQDGYIVSDLLVEFQVKVLLD